MTKLALFSLLAIFSTQAHAELDAAGRSDTGTVEFACKSPKLSKAGLRLEFVATSKYHSCDQTPMSSPESAAAWVVGKAGNSRTALAYGAESITSNGLELSKLPRAQLIEEMKKALPSSDQKVCKLAVVAIAAAKADKKHGERLDRRSSAISFAQKAETIAVCREANGKITVEAAAQNLECSGSDEESSAQYWDNGCI